MKTKSSYAKAGVNIDAKMQALSRIKKMIQGTTTADVAGEWGLFGGLFRAPGKDMILVSSIDGVGTKLKVAQMAGQHNTVGQDLVNHCVNDILAQGAEPLFFLDYVGISRLDPNIFADVVEGLCTACRQNGCALLGGETAEMPGLYPTGEYDLVGVIVGVVKKKNLITGQTIRPGDVAIGLPSSGLHTNGYSLAREVIFKQAKLKIKDRLPGTKKSVADALLAVHRSYLKPIRKLTSCMRIQGLAHITGGGFPDNIRRILPKNVTVVVDRSTWKVPPLFQFIEQAGKVDRDEMYKVFNMGIGMVIFVREDHTVEAIELLLECGEKPSIVGWVEKGGQDVRMIN